MLAIVSAAALLLVSGVVQAAGPDTTPPTIASARVIYDPSNPLETAYLEFIFSESVDWFHAISPSNYTDTNTGETGTQGFWYPPNRVEMRFTPQFFGYGTCEQVRVVKVVDLAGNEIVDDGIGNAFTFHLQQVLVQGHMNEHMQAHDAPPHAFAIEGNVAPLTWTPTCDVPLEDADADSTWTQWVFFDLPCTTATSGPETQDVELRFSHQCGELEPMPNRSLSLDLAAHPDGRDTLDVWWGDQMVTAAKPLASRPDAFALDSVAPNPARAGTFVAFSIAEPAHVELNVVDVRGRMVRRLAEGTRAAGPHRILWDGRTDQGALAPAGVYFVRFDAGHGVSARRIVLTR